MRLRLTVHRQSLPPVQVLWTTDGIQPNHPNGASITISQFLEQVNEVIPLEGRDWGLEDYVVENKGFECLHFSELCRVLKDDDEVIIRPLQTADIRYRKISGRHQISADGKHLIDGVAFGRPFLRRAERPAIKIPPRKRIRLTDDEDEGVVSYGLSHRQSYLPNGSNAFEGELDDGEGAYGDSDEDDSQDLRAELEDITKEQGHVQLFQDRDMSFHEDEVGSTPNVVTRSWKRRRGETQRQQGLGLQGEGMLQLMDENGRGYPGEYHNPLLEEFYEEEHLRPRKKARKASQRPQVRQSTDPLRKREKLLEEESRRSSNASLKSVRFDEEQLKTPATVVADDSEESEDEEFKPDEDSESISTESNKENLEPESATSSEDDDSSLSASSSSDSVSSDTSSSMSDSSSNSDSESDSNTGSDSDSGSESEEITTDVTKISTPRSKPPTARKAQSPSNQTSPKHDAGKTHQQLSFTPPGQGKESTRKRNNRRNKQKRALAKEQRLAYMKSIGVLASNATIADYEEWDRERQGRHEGDPSAASTSSNVDDSSQPAPSIEAKRQSLLESIANGGIDVDTNLDEAQNNQTPSAISHAADEDEVLDEKTALKPETEGEPRRVIESPFTQVQTILQPDIQSDSLPKPSVASFVPRSVTVAGVNGRSEPSRPRTRLDLSSSRRMLFGSLGLRAPTNKGEEDKLREKLMKNIRPVPQGQGKIAEAPEVATALDSNDGIEDWREKIVLKAVECCYAGLELSTPPFPFEQRWDPQQQGSRKTRKSSQVSGEKPSNKQLKTHAFEEESLQDEHVTAVNDRTQRAVDEQLMRDASILSVQNDLPVEDLPSPPIDTSILAELERDLAVPGAVVIFKRLEMSEATNWEPKVSHFQTAMIDNIKVDGGLEMTLALRDRPNKRRYYDLDTGERLYGKFEMPDSDSDETETNGFIKLAFEDLIEPKLLKVAEQVQDSKTETGQKLSTESLEVTHVDEDVDGQDIITVAEDLIQKLKDTREDHLPYRTTTSLLTMHNGIEQQHQAVDEDDRHDISDMIRDAGFRSSINPEVSGGFEVAEPVAASRTDELEDEDLIQSQTTPVFNGFSSSPPRGQEPTLLSGPLRESEPDCSGHLKEESALLPDPLRGLEQDSSAFIEQVLLSETLGESGRHSSAQDRQDSERYGSVAAGLTSFSNGQEQGEGSMLDLVSQIEERDHDVWRPISPSSRDRKANHASSPQEVAKSSSRPAISAPASVSIEKELSQLNEAMNDGGRSASDDELPTMEKIFRTARSRLNSQRPNCDDDLPSNKLRPFGSAKFIPSDAISVSQSQSTFHSEDQKKALTIEHPMDSDSDDESPAFEPVELSQTRKSEKNGSQRERSRKRDFQNNGSRPPTGSQKLTGSQLPHGSHIVDLTRSSDPVHSDASEYVETSRIKRSSSQLLEPKGTRSGKRNGISPPVKVATSRNGKERRSRSKI